LGAGAGPEIDDMIRKADDRGFVLDDEHRVALVAQPKQDAAHPLHVVCVQSHARLVEDVGHVRETRAQVSHELHSLRLATGQAAALPSQGEIAEPDVHQIIQHFEQ
jgi:hypothetical protein